MTSSPPSPASSPLGLPLFGSTDERFPASGPLHILSSLPSLFPALHLDRSFSHILGSHVDCHPLSELALLSLIPSSSLFPPILITSKYLLYFFNLLDLQTVLSPSTVDSRGQKPGRVFASLAQCLTRSEKKKIFLNSIYMR